MRYFHSALLLPLLLTLLSPLTQAADAAPPIPDPVPPVVRAQAQRLAKDGVLGPFELINQTGHTLYQVKLADAKTGVNLLMSFAADGSVVSAAEIPQRDAALSPPIASPPSSAHPTHTPERPGDPLPSPEPVIEHP